MRINYILTLAISLSFISAVPAWAYQSGGGNAQRGTRSAPTGQTPRGMTQQDRLRDQDQLKTRDRIYGSQLMTPAERNAYRKQMRSMKTNQERENLRMQHHEQMQKRAAERGMTLPDMPPRQGGGMGPGGGMGQGAGMGPGAGMGQRTMQQTQQQQKNQGKDQQIQQKQSTEQQTQQSAGNDGN